MTFILKKVYTYTMESFPAMKKKLYCLQKNGWNWDPDHHVKQNNSDSESCIFSLVCES